MKHITEVINKIVSALENLPEDLKNADPKTTPDYEKRITEALKDLKITIKIRPESGAITPQGSWWQCTIEIGLVIAQFCNMI